MTTTAPKKKKTSRQTKRVKQWSHQFKKPHYILIVLSIAVLVFVGFNSLRHNTHAAGDCTVSSELVNSCRPWLGAAVAGYPEVSSDAISQFDYAEQLMGHQFDIFHDYHPPGSLPLNSAEIHFADRANTYIYVNWKPASNWADADGSDASVNADIDQVAASIKSIAPHKIFLTIWHEPENDVSGGTSCAIKPGTAGTPAQYIAMWNNVENRFAADGVTNVVWVMNYMGYAKWDCLIPQLWPGNDLVDWVTFDTYGTNSTPTWADSVGRMYSVLQNDSNSTTDFDSKPWGVAEFGTCTMTDENQVYQYFQDAKAALDANTYPKLKMYMIYDDTGNDAGPGCLTNETINGTTDSTKQTYFNDFANDSIFTNSGSTTPSPASDTTPPSTPGHLHLTLATDSSITVAWNASTDNVGVAGYKVYRDGTLVSTQTGTTYTESKLPSSTSYTYTVKAYDAAGNISGGATLLTSTIAAPSSKAPSSPLLTVTSGNSKKPVTVTNGTTLTVAGTITIGNKQTSIEVDGKKISGNTLNTTDLPNGTHTITVTTKQPNGSITTSTHTINVNNQLTTWQDARDLLLARGSTSKLTTASLWGAIVMVLIITGYVVFRFKLHKPLRTKRHKSGR